MSSNADDDSPSVMPDITDLSPYGYIPTRWTAIMFIALFAVSTVLHTGQAVKYRMWWLFPTAVLAGLGELIGWSARLWSSYNILSKGFEMQIASTIIAPTPLLAANFIILSRIIPILGSQYSRLSARLYSRIFLTCDVIALTVQAVGGSLATAAETDEEATRGGNIALGGVAFQLAVITLFYLAAGEYFIRLTLNKPIYITAQSHGDVEMTNKQTANMTHPSSAMAWSPRSTIPMRMRLAIAGLMFSTFVLVVRGIYRCIELAGGWHGVVIQTEVYFNVFDGTNIVLAMYTLNILHPGYLLRS